MKLVAKGSINTHAMGTEFPEEKGLGKLTWKNYMPLIVIVGLILLTTAVIGYRDWQVNTFSVKNTISNFMAGFFIVFAGFKLIDLKGFAQGYFTYDLLAQRWFTYGYIYPFIELFFGLAMVANFVFQPLLLAEFIVMAFSGLGVTNKLLRGEKFQCVCLGNPS